MSNCPFTPSHLRYHYDDAVEPDDRPLRPEIDKGLFHHGEVGETLSVINEVANQLGIDAPRWCHFMEEALRHELLTVDSREEILCGLHELIASRLFQEKAGPSLHR